MVGCMRAKAPVCPRILNDVVMYVVVKGDVFEYIGLRCMKNDIVLCESRKVWFEFVAVYKTPTKQVNVMKTV